jgi:hypothetical protein
MEVKAGTLRDLYNRPQNNRAYDNALYMISKFLIQGIRAWGIFRNEGAGDHLSDIREVYSTFKYCVYDPIFGSITHDNDKDYKLVLSAF